MRSVEAGLNTGNKYLIGGYYCRDFAAAAAVIIYANTLRRTLCCTVGGGAVLRARHVVGIIVCFLLYLGTPDHHTMTVKINLTPHPRPPIHTRTIYTVSRRRISQVRSVFKSFARNKAIWIDGDV